MNRHLFTMFAITISLAFLIVIADAHIPITPNDGTTIATATEIVDPWKSWFYYSELDADEIHYYTFEAVAGDRIRFMLNVPIPEGDRGFTPGLVLMGPNVTDSGDHPGGLEVPGGVGVMVLEAGPLEADYEGFTPMSQYTTIDLNMSAPATGTYYVAVYEGMIFGRYALVTGYVETYSLLQWITVPSMAITIIIWSGQNLLFILIPMLLPFILGLILLLVRRRGVFTKENALSLTGTMGGFLILGSSLSFAYQMTRSLLLAPYNWTVIISILFTIFPLILGLAVLRIVNAAGWKNRIGLKISLILLGFVALFLWAGLYVGPTIAIVAGVISLFKR